MNKKVLVVLSGCGVYDGSEIHESVLTLLALAQNGISYQCAAPNIDQHHVVNHTNGEELDQSRNVLIESARIARGDILDLETVQANNYAGVVLPGGFGAAKNLSKWAFEGPVGDIEPQTARIINEAFQSNLPIAAFCMSPVVVSKAIGNAGVKLTVGSTEAPSPYEIGAISEGMESLGARSAMATVDQMVIDNQNKIVTSPCYMMEADIAEVNEGIQKAIEAFAKMI